MFVITGGGTGGHLAIVKALGQQLKKRKIKVYYIGSMQGQDRLWFEGSDLFEKCYFLQTTGVVNKSGVAKILALFNHLKALQEVCAIFKAHKIKVVISVGGFSAGPASIGAIVFRKPLFIHEQNAIKGRLNQILTPFARQVFSSFGKEKTPYPLKQEVLESKRVRNKLETIIFIGGSQGAKAINDLALQVSKELLQKGIKIIHQCGANDLGRVKQGYEKQNILESITLFDFSKDIIKHLNQADVCVGRSGASSVWENAALGLPMLYVPYPYAAQNHQVYNAKFFVDQDLGEMILQENLTKEKFFTFLDFMTKQNLESISKRLCEQVSQNGAEVIIDMILDSIK